MTANVYEIKRAKAKLKRLLRKVKEAAWQTNNLQAKTNIEKAYESLTKAEMLIDSFASIKFLDQTLSFGHHAINDLLHEMGGKSHRPSYYEDFYDIILPFKEDW